MLTRTPRCLVIATFKLFLNKKHLSTRVEANIDNVRKFSPSVKNKQKLLKVSIIGMPNAGKSTLINSLMDRKVLLINVINKFKPLSTYEKKNLIFPTVFSFLNVDSIRVHF